MNRFLAIMTAELLPLLAQLWTAGRKFPRRPSRMGETGITAIIVILILVLVALAFYIARRLITLLQQPGPDLALFVELAKAHDLASGDQRLLRRLARRERLSNPAKAFVERRHLEAYAKSNTNLAYRRLFNKLFAR